MSAPFIPVHDAIEVEVTFKLGGLYLCNRLWYYWPEDLWPPSPAAALAGAVGTWAVSEYLTILADNLELHSVRARERLTGGEDWVTFPFTGYFGSYGSEALSANVTILVRDKAIKRAGERRGGLYIPAPPRSAVVENTVLSSYADAFYDIVDDLYEPPGTLGVEWAVVSFKQGGEWRSEGQVHLRGIVRVADTVSPARYRMKNVDAYPP